MFAGVFQINKAASLSVLREKAKYLVANFTFLSFFIEIHLTEIL